MAKHQPPFSGFWPAALTAYDDDGEVCAKRQEKLVAHLIENGASGLFICGSTGEGVLLSVAERQRVAEITIGATGGQIPVMVHVGAISTRDATALAKHAGQSGAAAISSVSPIYYPLGPEVMFQFYHDIATAGEVPFYSYVFLGRGTDGCSIDKFIDGLVKIPHAAGVKYTSRDMFELAQLKVLSRGKLNIFSGSDECYLAAKMQGADGAVGSYYNAFLPHWEKIRVAAEAGQWEDARDLMAKAIEIVCAFLPYSLAGLKHVMRLKGIETGPTRGPMPGLADGQAAEIEQKLKSLELI